MLLNPETVENASIRFNVVQHENGAFQKRCRQMSAFSVGLSYQIKNTLYLRHKYHNLVQLNNKTIGNFTFFNAKLFRKFTEQGLTESCRKPFNDVVKDLSYKTS